MKLVGCQCFSKYGPKALHHRNTWELLEMRLLCFHPSWGWGPAVWVWMPLQGILIHPKVLEAWATLSFLPSSLSGRILNLEEGWQYTYGSNWKEHLKEVSREEVLAGRCCPLPLNSSFCFLPEPWMWGPAGKLPSRSLRWPHGKSALKIEELRSLKAGVCSRPQISHTSYGFLSSGFP